MPRLCYCHYKACYAPETRGLTFELCKRCCAVHYCSEAHYRADIDDHKHDCATIESLLKGELLGSAGYRYVREGQCASVISFVLNLDTVTAYEQAFNVLERAHFENFPSINDIRLGHDALFLLAGKDQECYDSAQRQLMNKFTNSASAWRVTLRGQGVIEGNLERMMRTYSLDHFQRSIFSAAIAKLVWPAFAGILLPKIKALLQLQNLHHSWLLASRLPLELFYQIQESLVDRTLFNNFDITSLGSVRELIRKLRWQIPRIWQLMESTVISRWHLPRIGLGPEQYPLPGDKEPLWLRMWHQALGEIKGAEQMLDLCQSDKAYISEYGTVDYIRRYHWQVEEIHSL